jgi:hypothetical protein
MNISDGILSIKKETVTLSGNRLFSFIILSAGQKAPFAWLIILGSLQF